MTSSRLRILVVDDNVDIATSLAKILELWRHEVCVAHDGLKAAELAQTFEPHVLLLDIGMPGMNGWELARRIRNSGVCQRSVFVAITGFGLDYLAQNSSQERFDHSLAKPLDFDALKKILTAIALAELADPQGHVEKNGPKIVSMTGTSSSSAYETVSENSNPIEDPKVSPVNSLAVPPSSSSNAAARSASQAQEGSPGDGSTP